MHLTSSLFQTAALDAATENAYSRMLVGIHFRRACTVGLEQGRAVGNYILRRPNLMKE